MMKVKIEKQCTCVCDGASRTHYFLVLYKIKKKCIWRFYCCHASVKSVFFYYGLKQGKRSAQVMRLSPPTKPGFEESDVHKVAPDSQGVRRHSIFWTSGL